MKTYITRRSYSAPMPGSFKTTGTQLLDSAARPTSSSTMNSTQKIERDIDTAKDQISQVSHILSNLGSNSNGVGFPLPINSRNLKALDTIGELYNVLSMCLLGNELRLALCRSNATELSIYLSSKISELTVNKDNLTVLEQKYIDNLRDLEKKAVSTQSVNKITEIKQCVDVLVSEALLPTRSKEPTSSEAVDADSAIDLTISKEPTSSESISMDPTTDLKEEITESQSTPMVATGSSEETGDPFLGVNISDVFLDVDNLEVLDKYLNLDSKESINDLIGVQPIFIDSEYEEASPISNKRLATESTINERSQVIIDHTNILHGTKSKAVVNEAKEQPVVRKAESRFNARCVREVVVIDEAKRRSNRNSIRALEETVLMHTNLKENALNHSITNNRKLSTNIESAKRGLNSSIEILNNLSSRGVDFVLSVTFNNLKSLRIMCELEAVLRRNLPQGERKLAIAIKDLDSLREYCKVRGYTMFSINKPHIVRMKDRYLSEINSLVKSRDAHTQRSQLELEEMDRMIAANEAEIIRISADTAALDKLIQQ